MVAPPPYGTNLVSMEMLDRVAAALLPKRTVISLGGVFSLLGPRRKRAT
jgi:hypothetical protein